MATDQFVYDTSNFEIETERGYISEFDFKLLELWSEKSESNLLKYNYEDKNSKRIPGRFKFLAELNLNRALCRRTPEDITGIYMEFDDNKFHFGKIDKNEVLFELKPNYWPRSEHDEDFNMFTTPLVLNVSPIGHCSSLLIPFIEKCSPQVLTLDALRIAVETVLISLDPALRVGMNSLGAMASVNHLHFHVYYLEKALYLENAPVKQLVGKCYEIEEYPAEGFAFHVIKKDKVYSVVRSVMKVIKMLQDMKIAHNVFITRGSSFSDTVSDGDGRFNAVRIYVWARKSEFGVKCDSTFNPAVCELAGHLIIKDEKFFNSIDEAEVSTILHDLCHDHFVAVRENVLKHKFL